MNVYDLSILREYSEDISFCELKGKAAGVNVGAVFKARVPGGFVADTEFNLGSGGFLGVFNLRKRVHFFDYCKKRIKRMDYPKLVAWRALMHNWLAVTGTK